MKKSLIYTCIALSVAAIVYLLISGKKQELSPPTIDSLSIVKPANVKQEVSRHKIVKQQVAKHAKQQVAKHAKQLVAKQPLKKQDDLIPRAEFPVDVLPEHLEQINKSSDSEKSPFDTMFSPNDLLSRPNDLLSRPNDLRPNDLLSRPNDLRSRQRFNDNELGRSETISRMKRQILPRPYERVIQKPLLPSVKKVSQKLVEQTMNTNPKKHTPSSTLGVHNPNNKWTSVLDL